MNPASVFLVAFLTSVLAASGSLYLIKRMDSSRETIVVPSVTGLQEADARRLLMHNDLLPMSGTTEASDKTRPGTVLRQLPPAGQALKAHQPVTLTIAQAPPSVPDVTGKPVAAATRLLEQAGYKVGVGSPEHDDTIGEGKVKSQDPAADQVLRKGGTVVLTPSAGVAEIEMPKLTGLSFPNAKKQLSDAGLKLGKVSFAYDDNLYPNVVLRQTPEAGKPIKPEGSVDLTVIGE